MNLARIKKGKIGSKSIISLVNLRVTISIVAVLTAAPALASAVNLIWANNATSGAPIINNYDLNGNLLQTFTAAHGDNGRGIVQVGNIVYYTSAGTNGVYGYNFVTNTDLGTLFTVTGASGLAPMAYDGANFYIGDYSGTNNVYKYSPTGTLLGTIALANCTGYCDGLEYANGKLISNRSDTGGIYDVYSLTGTLLQSAFITTGMQSTGIAYDGASYYVTNVYAGTIGVYNNTGAFDHMLTLVGGYHLDEDLSVNYTAVLSGTPEPETWALMLAGFGFSGASMRRRATKVTFA